ncbi:ATP synthase subunit delta, chloroplastic [Gastrolobium bilobum]|uniref:ATP synthase subunit delta, chloroplastic n=1 Tax=Gastrolobium bilobum TaxID=150636 RepID=UPI002AAF7158|nr:ATP synthase subunit delta, chloroplastic [Gastrolobium bilobum]
MDTLSSSVSTLKVPTLPPTNREFYHFKRTTYATPNCPPNPQPHVSSTSLPNLVPKTKTFSHKSSTSLALDTSPLKLKPSSPIFHRKPATGYAAAVIDVAQSSNSLHMVQKDVQSLLKFIQHVTFQSTLVDPSMVEELKGQAMRHVVEQGNFHGHLVGLLKMLLKKNKVGIVQEVLEEFERIYDELCGTQVVLVSSTTKMGEEELFGIAKSVQQLSGAVRVKVRNLVQSSELCYVK